MLFKRKIEICAPATGRLLSIEEVPDEVFSSKMMGNGFAVSHHHGKIYAPAAGTVRTIFPTQHALTVELVDGRSLLIHMGIETVALAGEPFTIAVQENQSVTTGELLAEMDVAAVEEMGKETMVIVVFMEEQGGKCLRTDGDIQQGEAVFHLK